MDATQSQLSDRMASFARALGEALAQRLGSGVRLEPAAIEAIEQGDGAPGEQVVHARCPTLGEPATAIHLVVPSAEAKTLAALRLGHEKEQIAAERDSALDAESIEALGELVQLATRELARAFAGSAGNEGLVREDEPAEVRAPIAEGAWLDPGRYLRARFALGLDGFPDGRLDLLLPVGEVERWSGAESTAGGAPAGPLAIVDADPDAAAQVEALAGRLGRAVVHVDPAALARRDADAVESVASAAAIVVAWELAGRAGLELAESLGRDARARGAALALASDAPTPAMVRAALRAGATSFVIKPYDADELSRRLLRPPGSRDV